MIAAARTSLGVRTLSALPCLVLIDRFARDLGRRHPKPDDERTVRLLPAPIGEVRIFIDRYADEGAVVVDPPLEAETIRTISGALVLTLHARGRDGVLRTLRPGTYEARISSTYYREKRVVLDLSQPRAEHELAPGPAYPFPPNSGEVLIGSDPTILRGALRRADGSGIGGARVEVSDGETECEWTTDDTGTSGEWVLVGFAKKSRSGAEPRKYDVDLRITLPDGATFAIGAVTLNEGRQTILTQTNLRGLVRVGRTPARAATVKIIPGAETARSDASGAWRYFFAADQSPGRVTIEVTLADGRTQRVDQQVAKRVTTVVPTIHFPDA